MAIKRILILGHSNIGDVCYDLVVVPPLRKQYPEAEIYFLTSTRAENIVQDYPGIASVLIFDRRKDKKNVLRRLGFTVHLAKMRFDLVVVLKNTLRQYFLGGPKILDLRKFVGSAFSDKKGHIVDSYFQALRFYNIDPGEPEFQFNISPDEKDFCDDFFRKEGIGAGDKIIGILPFAAWSMKSWPMDKWNKLAEIFITEYRYHVVAFSQTHGDCFAQSEIKKMSSKILSVDNVTLKQAMGIIKRCDFFIGPDSSLLHLASCMGVETIGLYGPTPDAYIYPYFHRYNVIKAREKYDCMPCTPKTEVCSGRSSSQAGECMEAINSEDIVSLVKQKRGVF